MIFKIDTMPLTKQPVFSCDYISRLVYSATSDPLLILSGTTNTYVPNSCVEVLTADFKLYTIKTRKDLFFSDGTPVYAHHFVEHINKARSQLCYIGLFLKNVCVCKAADNYTFTIELFQQDLLFQYVLSMYQLSPTRYHLDSCGPFEIDDYSESTILLSRNAHYRQNGSVSSILFSRSTNYEADIDGYYHNELDVTNNTTFPFDKIHNHPDIQISPSYIWANITFSPTILAKNGEVRRAVLTAVDRDALCRAFNYYMIPASDYLMNDYEVHSKNESSREKSANRLSLSFGYDDFYPNELMANIIRSQLEKQGIKVALIVNEFGKRNSNDLNLTLMYPPFWHDVAFYYSPYFYLLSKISGNDAFLLSMDELKHNPVSYPSKEIADVFMKTIPVIPLAKMKSIYLINREYSAFDFWRCNYQEL